MSALVEVLRGIQTGRDSRAVLAPGHYANVLDVDGKTGLALSTDGVGTKVIVAEQLGRVDLLVRTVETDDRHLDGIPVLT